MKKHLLFTALLATSIGFSQNFIQNGTGDEWSASTGDNADAFDMSPNSTVLDNTTGQAITSPYRITDENPTGWRNTALETYLSDTYIAGGSVDEQPGSTSNGTYDGATKTRALKLYDDGGQGVELTTSTRRLYQRVTGLTSGESYVFSVESRSIQPDVTSEVFIITDDNADETFTTEVGLDDPDNDSRVIESMEITNDYNETAPSEGDNTFTTNTLSFVADGESVILYVRALNAVGNYTDAAGESKNIDVYLDNLSIMVDSGASTKDVLASKFNVYPNPAKGSVKIASSDVELTSVQLYNALGNKVYSTVSVGNSIDVSSLASGVYFLRLNADGASTTKKLIVE